MPAIQLTRLKIQSARLSEDFSHPDKFVRGLRDLLELYADRTRRPGQTGEPAPLLRAFNVPAPVMRQVLKDLAPLMTGDHQGGLALCQALWAEPTLEFRLLAAHLLGLIPLQTPEELLERVQAWAIPGSDERLVATLVEMSLASVRRDHPDVYLKKVGDWLSDSRVFYQQTGLKALAALVDTTGFEDFPALFRLLAPLVRTAPSRLRSDLLDVIKALAEHAPKEAAFFLRQNLEIVTDNPGTAWLVRNGLRYFPADTQASLKAALRGR